MDAAALPFTNQVATDDPADDGDRNTGKQGDAEIAAEDLDGGHRARVRDHDGVHSREGRRGGDAVEQERASEAARHGEDDRKEDHQAGIEEDREPEQEGRDAEGQRSTFLAEPVDEGVGEDLRAARRLEEPSEHHAEPDEESDAAEHAREAGGEHRPDVWLPLGSINRDPRRHGRDEAHEDQRHKRMDLQLHDHDEEQRNGSDSDQEQYPCAVYGFNHGSGLLCLTRMELFGALSS